MNVLPSVCFTALAFLLSPGCSEPEQRIPQSGNGGGGGGSGGGGSRIDAMASRSDAMPALLSGTLCLVSDLRAPFLCPTTDLLEGITVSILGTETSTITSESGEFSLPAPNAASATLEISFGEDTFRDVLFQVSLTEQGANDVKGPAILETTWQSLLTTVGVAEPGDTASLATYYISAKAPFDAIAGVEVTDSGGTVAPLYDGPLGPEDWRSGAVTGENGAALLLGLPVDASSIDIDVAGTLTPQQITDIPISADALTVIQVVVNSK